MHRTLNGKLQSPFVKHVLLPCENISTKGDFMAYVFTHVHSLYHQKHKLEFVSLCC